MANGSKIQAKAAELRRLLAIHQERVGLDGGMELGSELVTLATDILKMKEGMAVRVIASPPPETDPIAPAPQRPRRAVLECRRVPVQLPSPPVRPCSNDRARANLTPRMIEIARLIAEGRSNKEMAYLLKLSTKTIETHRMALMQRIGAQNIAGVVRFVFSRGLLDQP